MAHLRSGRRSHMMVPLLQLFSPRQVPPPSQLNPMARCMWEANTLNRRWFVIALRGKSVISAGSFRLRRNKAC
ncbi:MAG: hypothetical protein RIR18_289 [Pseudomonadota bacterium]